MNITVYHISKSMSIKELWSVDKLEELDTTIISALDIFGLLQSRSSLRHSHILEIRIEKC